MLKKIIIIVCLLAILLAGVAYAIPTPFIYYIPAGSAGILVCESGIPSPSIGADGSAVQNCLTEPETEPEYSPNQDGDIFLPLIQE